MRINTLKVGMSLFLAAILLTFTSSVWLNSPLRVMAALPPKILLNQVGYSLTWQKQAFLLNGGELDHAEVAVIDRTTGHKVYVCVVRGDGNKAPYLRTRADGKWRDNLLALEECTGTCKLIG